MALGTYDELKAAIAEWLARDDLTNNIDDFIDLAEARHRRDLRIRKTLTSVTAALSATRFYDLPADFVAPSELYITYSQIWTVNYASPAHLRGEFSQAPGRPRWFTIIGTQFELNRVPDSTDNYTLSYFKKPAALSSSQATNEILTDHPDAYLYAALAASAPFLTDDMRVSTWEGLYMQTRDSINNANAQDMVSQRGPLVTRSDTGNP